MADLTFLNRNSLNVVEVLRIIGMSGDPTCIDYVGKGNYLIGTTAGHLALINVANNVRIHVADQVTPLQGYDAGKALRGCAYYGNSYLTVGQRTTGPGVIEIRHRRHSLLGRVIENPGDFGFTVNGDDAFTLDTPWHNGERDPNGPVFLWAANNDGVFINGTTSQVWRQFDLERRVTVETWIESVNSSDVMNGITTDGLHIYALSGNDLSIRSKNTPLIEIERITFNAIGSPADLTFNGSEIVICQP